ncbi:hypothetical protein [Treponema pectinovorum]|uniref:hypothetical protein n=1 Tax=Treponema pectinovorum TaxID=164 RepID=UPI0011CA364E|nr:hypothetical protein [Treponema pectinovorum]
MKDSFCKTVEVYCRSHLLCDSAAVIGGVKRKRKQTQFCALRLFGAERRSPAKHGFAKQKPPKIFSEKF